MRRAIWKGRNERKMKQAGERQKGINGNVLLCCLYFGLYLLAASVIALNQPLQDTYPYLSNPPDEHSRYLVPLYICNHGTLPTGFEEELFSGDCRWTYGFYTLLPYMIQGYAMRFVKLFTQSPLALLYTARFVNVFVGLMMAWVVRLISRKVFDEELIRWLFCFLVTFLPQSIFLHTYVNPDSLCLLSTALIIYGLLCGYEDGFCRKSCLILAAGVILCALSYYNAYGFILSGILLFSAYFLKRKDGKWSFDWRAFLRKGLGISALVLLCVSWSFIRNYILYDGDIIGLETKENFIMSFGIERETMKTREEPLFQLFTNYPFLKDMVKSFIANYGSTSIFAPRSVYLFYLALFGAGGLCAAVFHGGKPLYSFGNDKQHRIFFHINMIFCVVMPFILLVRYAYGVDYQAQGRYILPGIIPIMLYVVRGVEKIPVWRKLSSRGRNLISGILMGLIVLCLVRMVFEVALSLYLESEVL